MRVLPHKKFQKKLNKYPFLKEQAEERIILFITDPFHPILNNHPLVGKWEGYRSINITGDFRAIFEFIEDDVAYFVDLDTHSNLYK
jgi:addiction module RelE/StbE family toxin